jgi:quercetin dioxygenase-like cupin family protein
MNSTKQGNIKAKALKLADLISYQKGTVVSREIINKKTGTVTVFAFDKGEGLSEHTAPFDALVYILDGEAKIFISGKPHPVKKDDIIIMPANKPHALKAIERFKMLLVMVRS